MNDYLNFELEMILKGKEYLFENIIQLRYSNIYKDITIPHLIKWKEISIDGLFIIKSGKSLIKNEQKKGKIPFIGSSSSNNGITNFVSNKNETFSQNLLGLNSNGSVGDCFYHPYFCLFSSDVKRLFLKHKEGNKYIYLFLKTCILQQKEKYSYGYKLNEKRMRQQKIKVPMTKDNEVDYTYMENYMKWIEKKLLLKK